MGTLEIIMGPMFSGKTELLIEKYNTEFLINSGNISMEKIIAFNYHKDTRYGNEGIVSHSGKKISSFNIESLNKIFEDTNFSKRTHIFINEAQFFSNLKQTIIILVEKYNKNVIICGLDSDYKREKFGDMWDLIPYADYIVKLKGKCNDCTNYSIFTYRISNEKEQEVIGTDNYIPLCRKCYNSR
jgi:thymidine kinase